MSEAQVPNRDFVPVENKAEATALLKQGVKHKSSAIVWTKNQERVFNTHLSDLTEGDKKLHVWLPYGTDYREVLNEIAEKGHKEWFFSVSLSAANIFFKARFITINEAALVFAVPENLFKVQRRKDFRLPIPDGYVLKIEFDDPLVAGSRMSLKCLDISAGGVSFVVRLEERPLFQMGAILKNVRLKIRGHDIQCDAEIRHARDLPEGTKPPGSKIGIQFRSILPGDTQKVAQFVFEETRRFVSKIL